MTNKVNIEFLSEQLDKALKDIEELKDKVRENKNGNGVTLMILELVVALLNDSQRRDQRGTYPEFKLILTQVNTQWQSCC